MNGGSNIESRINNHNYNQINRKKKAFKEAHLEQQAHQWRMRWCTRVRRVQFRPITGSAPY